MNIYKVTANEDGTLVDFIDKNMILKYASEEEIFSLVFGFEPEEYQYVTSPLREDNIPNAYFERYYYSKEESKLLFKDWADTSKNVYDCFDMVQSYYNLPNFKSTLQFIKTHIIDKRPLVEIEKKTNINFKKGVDRTIIQCSTRSFDYDDKLFWEPYGISSDNLREDKVLRVSRYFIQKPIDEYRTIQNCYTQTYVYTEFESGAKKLYMPLKQGNRFITNCTQNDIGGLLTYKNPTQDDTLIITKSYKDCRVLINQGYNAIWFQNEGMIPDLEILLPLVEGFEKIVIFFDNDETGVKASYKLFHLLESYFSGEIQLLHLPFNLLDEKIKDPSDMIKHKGRDELNNFLTLNI